MVFLVNIGLNRNAVGRRGAPWDAVGRRGAPWPLKNGLRESDCGK